jgi:AraC-like DNA-binding protein
MDVLSDVLAAVRLTGAIFFDWHFTEPWVGESPSSRVIASRVMPQAEHVILFHIVLDGACWIAVAGSDDFVQLVAGDVIILPKGDATVIASGPRMRPDAPDLSVYDPPMNRALPLVFRQGGGGDMSCRLVCGFLGCDARPFNPMLEALPQIVIRQLSDASRNWMSSLMQLAAQETESAATGGEAMLAKLAELMFVEVLRKYVDELPADSRGWLSALRDRQLSRAMRLIHARPERAWTIDALAQEAGLSRSAFAHRFSSMMGTSPMQYLARWRMQLAARRLEAPGVSVAQVGAEVGYDSEAAFNRAFKKYVGMPPGTWRKGRGLPIGGLANLAQ